MVLSVTHYSMISQQSFEASLPMRQYASTFKAVNQSDGLACDLFVFVKTNHNKIQMLEPKHLEDLLPTVVVDTGSYKAANKFEFELVKRQKETQKQMKQLLTNFFANSFAVVL